MEDKGGGSVLSSSKHPSFVLGDDIFHVSYDNSVIFSRKIRSRFFFFIFFPFPIRIFPALVLVLAVQKSHDTNILT